MATAVVSLALAPACAFERGEPWGEADLSLFAQWAPGPDRLTAQGRLKTDTDYAIDLVQVAVGLDALTLRMAGSGGAGGVAFDPAHPPEGYSLCHGGHCHADDGRLVPYDEVAAEAAGGAAGGASVTRPIDGADLPLAPVPRAVPLGECPGRCYLERGRLSALELLVAHFAFEARVFDRRTGAAARLPAEGIAVRAGWDAPGTVRGPLRGRVDEGEPVRVVVAATFQLTDRLFDGVDWSAAGGASAGDSPADLSTNEGLMEVVMQHVTGDSVLATEVRRE